MNRFVMHVRGRTAVLIYGRNKRLFNQCLHSLCLHSGCLIYACDQAFDLIYAP